MIINVGINGFGRIGRVIFRTCHQNPDLQVTAINDPAIDVEYICYLIKFDSTHGKFKSSLTHTQNEIKVDDQTIKVFHEKLPANVPWQSAEVHYVVEASGIFTNLQKASGHLSSEGVKRVIVTAPSADVPMVILGVNDGDFTIDKRVISSASSTLYCLAPIVKILNDKFGVSEGFLTSIHAMTPSLKPLDGLCLRGKHWRDHRSIHQNIIPAATGACRALGKIIPQMRDKLLGIAFRVPIVNVSVLDLTLKLNKETSIEEITKCVEAFSKTTMANIVKISNEDAVSSDFVGDQHSCILDVDSSLQLKKDFFKLVCWYENEYSYACRVVDLIFYSEKQYQMSDNKTTFVRTRPTKKATDDKGETHSADPSINSSQVSLRTSQVKLMRPIRPSTAKRPSPNIFVDEMSNDRIFKIYNDDVIKKRLRFKNVNVHSFDEIVPKNRSSNVKTQERLENVKKEFSKMVNITERLLQKCNKVCQSNSSDIADEKPKIANDGSDYRKSLDNTVKNRPSFNNTDVSEVSGNNLSIMEERDSRRSEFNADNFSDSNRNSLMYISPKPGNSCSTLTYNINCNSAEAVKISDNNLRDQTSKTQIVGDLFQNQVVKTINNLIEGLTKSIDKKICSKFKINNSIENMDTEKATDLNESLGNKSDSGFVSPVKIETTFGECCGDNVINQCSEAKSIVEVGRVEIEVDPTFDNGKSIHNNTNVEAIDHPQSKTHLADGNTINAECKTASIKRPNKSPAEILNSLNKFFDPVVIRAGTSGCDRSALGSPNNSETDRKMDLYDKLDSVSGSDSDNSFQINERKSQVINISDLTNSLEDLVRLDKICRIIEISDELSDRLFSALGNSDNAAIQKTKWSFKDLCQRIKLDEFCNSLFAGQSCHYEQKK